MAIDTGIVDPSNCILLDPGGAAWWLSNAVFMEGPDKSTANPGPNTTDVVVTWKAGSSPDNPCQLQIPTVLLELYVGDPSLVMSPLNTVELTESGSPLVPGPVVVSGLNPG